MGCRGRGVAVQKQDHSSKVQQAGGAATRCRGAGVQPQCSKQGCRQQV
ncbi:hypothetical protein SLEP1_g54671 [Rubroshorea leprosula]|uniref:Uncharacterized protein n=1 Tax=Rubroshorea leprosula TaxID=152421 RepID=A0AAV5MDN9_9ROSI|nr:hypothetical protein SLEP1_g54671 [Rubroshorea leprosula]